MSNEDITNYYYCPQSNKCPANITLKNGDEIVLEDILLQENEFCVIDILVDTDFVGNYYLKVSNLSKDAVFDVNNY